MLGKCARPYFLSLNFIAKHELFLSLGRRYWHWNGLRRQCTSTLLIKGG